MVQFTQQHRFEFKPPSCLLVETSILNGNSRFISEKVYQLHLLRTEQMAMAAINAEATKDLILHFERNTEHRMDFGGDKRVTMNKAVLISVEAINMHAGPASLHSSASTALTNIDVQVADQIGSEAIMSKDMQAATVRIEFKNAGALRPGEVDRLGCDHL